MDFEKIKKIEKYDELIEKWIEEGCSDSLIDEFLAIREEIKDCFGMEFEAE